jgi:Nickel/cobalt transporter regulator
MRAALSLLLIAALAIPAPALAGNKGNNGKKKHVAPAEQMDTNQAIVTLITAAERSIILGYLNHHQSSLPAPLATAKPLPPGIAKKIARGGSLPPGIAKRYLPNELLVQLPPRPGCQWVVVGTDVLLIAAATGLIVDVLADAL